MNKFLKRLISSKYIHLCLGATLLYGISWAVTQPTLEEKILDSLRKYCIADYWVRESIFSEERMEGEFYRERYRERLESLTAGLFDYRDRTQIQAFFLPRGFLYEAWEEGGNRSYLLAEIVGRGRREKEFPERVAFDYLILGKKRVKPFMEFKHGNQAGRLVSAGDEMIYLHRDRIDSLLWWYFDSLWETEPQKPDHYYRVWKGEKDPLTYFLYQDLRGVCEDVFVKRLWGKKRGARDYFVEQGFNLFLPSLLAMAARMAGDKGLRLHPEERYLRSLLSGLSEYPTYTLFYIMSQSRPYSNKPSVKKIWKETNSRLNLSSPERISLVQISQVSRELLQRMEKIVVK
jgi:hypothetical protein